MRFLSRVAILLLVAAAAAAVTNRVRPDGIRWIVSRSEVYPPPTTQQVAAAITRDEVEAALWLGAVIIDARVEEKYHNGHIPAAHNLPAETAEQDLWKVSQWAHFDDVVIVYCGGAECDESLHVYELLRQARFTNLRLYFGGWQDWMAGGKPVEETVAP
jgi:3-mercaptopyruvate sulfurtransferase SseA